MIAPDSIVAATAQALSPAIVAGGCVVAVSGGPDSVGLLHAMIDVFRSQQSSAPLIVAHMNHGLRGLESDGDEEFVRTLFDHLARQPASPRVQLACTRVNVSEHAGSPKQNIESLARNLRYAWLADQARAHAVSHVLTAHTLNDQAETTLFHILRGTGIQGLRGMRSVRRLQPGIFLVRPWLALEKSVVLAYLKDQGLEFRIDSSNLDRRLSRNRIRHDLLPKLQAEYNGRIIDALAGLGRHAAHASRLLDLQAKRTLKRVEKPRVDSLLIFDRHDLQQLPLEALQAFYVHVWRREDWPRGHMGSRTWERLARWTHGARSALDLPDGIRAVKRRGVVQLGPRR